MRHSAGREKRPHSSTPSCKFFFFVLLIVFFLLIVIHFKIKFRENLPNSQKFRGPTQSGRSQGSQR